MILECILKYSENLMRGRDDRMRSFLAKMEQNGCKIMDEVRKELRQDGAISHLL